MDSRFGVLLPVVARALSPEHDRLHPRPNQGEHGRYCVVGTIEVHSRSLSQFGFYSPAGEIPGVDRMLGSAEQLPLVELGRPEAKSCRLQQPHDLAARTGASTHLDGACSIDDVDVVMVTLKTDPALAKVTSELVELCQLGVRYQMAVVGVTPRPARFVDEDGHDSDRRPCGH